jgi:endonuclease/exonuclease/phosphatase family metal-dependent hydrolase
VPQFHAVRLRRSLAVASFNMLWGVRPRSWEPFDAVGAARRLDADVLVLQESWRPDGEQSVAERVASELGYECYEVVLARGTLGPPRPKVVRAPDEGTGDWCLAVLTRVPIVRQEAHPIVSNRIDKAERSIIVTDVEVDDTVITVAGAHLMHMERGSLRLRGPLSRILPATDRPGVFAGDLNTWGVVAEWLLPGWRRAVRGRTWPSHRPHSQIDHILVTTAVEVVRGEVVPLVESDHLPVRAVLQF